MPKAIKQREIEKKYGPEGFRRLFEIVYLGEKDVTLAWKVQKAKIVKIGKPITCKDGRGYYTVQVDGAALKVHRIIYIMLKGEIPERNVIDHVDRCRTNNAESNLRAVSVADNRKNTSLVANKTSKYRDVCWHKASNRWVAQITDANGKKVYLGIFKEEEAAAKAVYWYKAWLLAVYGENTYYGPCC